MYGNQISGGFVGSHPHLIRADGAGNPQPESEGKAQKEGRQRTDGSSLTCGAGGGAAGLRSGTRERRRGPARAGQRGAASAG